MIFGLDLIPKVLDGTKTVTRRPMSDNRRSPYYRRECRFKPGREYAIQPGRGKPSVGRMRVLSVTDVELNSLTHPDAIREGFANSAEFISYWRSLYGSEIDWRQRVWRIELEVIEGGVA